jgi:lipopolysaccharide biosynthesis protein
MDKQKSNLKFITFYLPQFHRIKENDEWWGEGFTEWTNTKKSIPMFDNHRQPREPLNDYYYDLTDPGAHQWQSGLMNEYNIYGLCIFHYWFCGKLLLQKPAELLLNHPEIRTNFCFSWANEPWSRNWDGRPYSVLMPQNYGKEDDWEKHFQYLLPFFQDGRYIKIDGKPLFILYVADEIEGCADMIACWRRLAAENGLPGLYIAETKRHWFQPDVKGTDACIELEPSLTVYGGYTPYNTHQYILNAMHIFAYNEVWNKILERKSAYAGREKFCGAFVDWDNSPRTGVRARVCVGSTPDKFKSYLVKLVQKCINEGNDRFIFINAWNEWGEGAYLEPDKENAYGYLEAVKEVSREFGLIDNK